MMNKSLLDSRTYLVIIGFKRQRSVDGVLSIHELYKDAAFEGPRALVSQHFDLFQWTFHRDTELDLVLLFTGDDYRIGRRYHGFFSRPCLAPFWR